MDKVRTYLLFAALLVLSVLLVTQWLVLSPSTSAQGRVISRPIGAARIDFNASHLLPAAPDILLAFVPTGSLNNNCLATFAESSFMNDPVPGATMFCAPREPVGLGKGVVVTMLFLAAAPPDAIVSITLYHEGALRYGTPVLCNVEGC